MTIIIDLKRCDRTLFQLPLFPMREEESGRWSKTEEAHRKIIINRYQPDGGEQRGLSLHKANTFSSYLYTEQTLTRMASQRYSTMSKYVG